MARVKSNLLLAIWDSFHDNGIEFAYPQRDLHIVDEGKILGGLDILFRAAQQKSCCRGRSRCGGEAFEQRRITFGKEITMNPADYNEHVTLKSGLTARLRAGPGR